MYSRRTSSISISISISISVLAQDVEVLWRSAVLHSEDVQSAIRPHLPALRDLHNPPKTSVIKKGAPAWRYLDMVMLLQRAHLLRYKV